MGQFIVEDTVNTWPALASGLVAAAICSLITIAIMRWVAGPIVWISIIGVLTLLGAGELIDFNLFVIVFHSKPIFSDCYDFHKTFLHFSVWCHW